MTHLQTCFAVSQRRCCRALGICRASLRYIPKLKDDEAALLAQIERQRREHPCWGYRKHVGLLRQKGWLINKKRVERLWRQQGWALKKAPPKKRAPGHDANACHIRRAEKGNQVWAIDFTEDKTHDKKTLKILTVLDEYTREALLIEVGRKMGHKEVQAAMTRLFKERGRPEFVRSDNGSEFRAKQLVKVLQSCHVESAWIAPGSPWQNGKNERLNGILKQELLKREVLMSTTEAQALCEQWRKTYNQVRPHGSLGLLTPQAYAASAKREGRWFYPQPHSPSLPLD